MKTKQLLMDFRKRVLAVAAIAFVAAFLFTPCVLATDIAIYGDSQHNEEIERAIVKDILKFKPAAVFRVGDMMDDGNNEKLWERFDAVRKLFKRTTAYNPVLGNHEANSRFFYDRFPFLKGKGWYSADFEGIHFIVLDSNSALSPGSEQYAWLESDLKQSAEKAVYRIALFHHPLHSGGGHSDDQQGLRPALLPLFQKYGVSAVFSGHDHNYQRLSDEGIIFIVTGGGGSVLRDVARNNPLLIKYEKAYHFCLLIPEKSGIRVRVYGVRMDLIDEFEIPPKQILLSRQ